MTDNKQEKLTFQQQAQLKLEALEEMVKSPYYQEKIKEYKRRRAIALHNNMMITRDDSDYTPPDTHHSNNEIPGKVWWDIKHKEEEVYNDD